MQFGLVFYTVIMSLIFDLVTNISIESGLLNNVSNSMFLDPLHPVSPKIQYREDYQTAVETLHCRFVYSLPERLRCQFVIDNKKCDDGAQFISYHYFMFCTLPPPSENLAYYILGVSLMVLWLVVLFLFLGTTADEFFCPSLAVAAKVLHLSENLAGVTILAFGNGSPDIFTALSGPDDDTELMYNELLGAGMFVTTIIAGMIAVIRPFKLQAIPFIRDTAFFLFSAYWIERCGQDQWFSLNESISLIIIYLAYLLVVIITHCTERYRNKKRQNDVETLDGSRKAPSITELDKKGGTGPINIPGTELQLPRDSKKKKTSSQHANLDMVLKTERMAVLSKLGEDQMLVEERKGNRVGAGQGTKQFFAEFWEAYSPIDEDEWKESNCGGKMCSVIKVPPLMILRLYIPVVNLACRNNGWSKPLNLLHCITLPTIVVCLLRYYLVMIGGVVPLCVITLLVGILFAVTVLFTSVANKAPRYHNVFVLLGLIGSIITVYTLANEVVELLHLFGTLLQITDGTLGLTVLAWGNSIGDAIANIAIGKQGFQRMGFAACFGGPMLNTLLGMGIAFSISSYKNPNKGIKINPGAMGPITRLFLFISLSLSLVYTRLTLYEARKSFGIFLIIMYLMYLIYAFLAEFDIVQALGGENQYRAINTSAIE